MTEQPNGQQPPSRAFRWGAATDTGKVREKNEDAHVVEPEAGLFLVADGMGGHRGGRLASKMVVQDLPPMIEIGIDTLRSRSPRSIRRLIGKAVAEQNRHLHLEGNSESGYVGMGATLVLILLVGERLYMANVGDSRIYRLRQGRLRQFSVDHSVVSELLEQGHITPEEAENHSDRGVITQYMGMPESTEPVIRSQALKPGDRFLLCSDGLTDMVSEAALAEMLCTEAEPQVACDKLVQAANAAGGYDNITVVIVDWTGRRQAPAENDAG